MAELARRDVLRAAAALGAAAPFLRHGPVLAQTSDSIAVGTTRDIQGALDPANRVSFQEGNVLRSVLQGLVAFKPGTFEWEPDAASAIRQVSDTVIEFVLKPGLAFGDGLGDMTAEDVKFSLERFLRPGPDGKAVVYAQEMDGLDSVEVTGPLSGRILLKRPLPAMWLTILPDISGLIVSRKAFEAGAYRAGEPPLKVPGSGPYALKEWVPNERLVLAANPAFKGPKPGFAEVVLRPIRDPKTAELALRANELQFTKLEPASADALGRLPATTLKKQDSINLVWIGINVQKPPFDDLRVRQAIRAALDVDQMVLGAYNGAVARATGPVPPNAPGYWADAPKPARDVALAKRLLNEAGHGGGLRARLTLLNQPAYQSAGVIAQALLAEAGIRLDLEVLEGGAYWSMGEGDAGKNLELSLQRFGGKADPNFMMQWFVTPQIGTWNWQRWSSPEYDRLFERVASTVDAAERGRMLIEMQRLMDRSAAFVFLTHEAHVFGYRDWLRPGILPNGDDLQLYNFRRA